MRKVVEDKDPHNGYYGFGSHTAPKFIWAIANAICFASLVLQVFSIYTPDWRISQPITYSYMHLGSRRYHVVGQTRYGLQTIIYDNGASIQPWTARVNSVKSKGYTAIQYNEQVGKGTFRSVDASFCPNACRDAILVRMQGYEQIMMQNNLLLSLLFVGCTLAVMGISWYIFFDDNVLITGGFWVSAGVIVGLSTLYWKHHTHALWKTICSIQQMPFPFTGPNFNYTLLAAALLIGATVLVSVFSLLASWNYHRCLQKSLQSHLRNKQTDFDPYSDMTTHDIFKSAAAPTVVPPQGGLNPSQLFSGIGFAQDQKANYQHSSDSTASGPSMWNTNLKY
ncbi:hypothetical protein X943_002477 [Babesia divergens]|uniref:Uncharacterized protein n=1 Tax=Babesia divergens TaxID=32595 RepID=A0AAD9GHK7_BABDI|nr:hypothetical protein X943_002477 [Babesia divergens]